MKIIVNASNIHSGGGKTLLVDFLKATTEKKHIRFHIFLDSRFDYSKFLFKNVNFHSVDRTKRFFVHSKIESLLEEEDVIFYFGNIPPLKKHSQPLILFLQNRMVVEKISLKAYPLRWRLRVPLERLLFKIGMNNADQIIVQTSTMKDILKALSPKMYSGEVRVLPFKDSELFATSKDRRLEKQSFIYIAGPDPHKNHKNLLYAWKILDTEDIKPHLYLTIDSISFKKDYVYLNNFIEQNNLNITVESNLSRKKIFERLKEVSALIYPSLFEAYGLPLVEANKLKIPIIASELDFVRDLVDPVESFDPKSPKSISRAVKRFLAIEDNKEFILTAGSLIDHLVDFKDKEIRNHSE